MPTKQNMLNAFLRIKLINYESTKEIAEILHSTEFQNCRSNRVERCERADAIGSSQKPMSLDSGTGPDR